MSIMGEINVGQMQWFAVRLMQQWGGGHLTPQLRRYLKTGSEFVPGDTARVVAGPLDGYQLRVVEADGTSVRGLMVLLGGDVEVDIGSDLLEMVNA